MSYKMLYKHKAKEQHFFETLWSVKKHETIKKKKKKGFSEA